jgi:NadR type nicotinamide-nucleotide adenylyltransferase
MKIGICFGGYCPLHQGHLDLIMKSKKENDLVYLIICGFDEEPRALEIGLPLRRRISLVRKLFLGDEQIKVLELNDSDLGIDESMSSDNWKIWTEAIKHKIQYNDQENTYTWYLAEENYKTSLEALGYSVCLMERINPISGTQIRKEPLKYWNKIALTFRPYFSTNILITGTASEGKSTLTRDIATYFGLPYMTEYGRTYMEENGKTDIDLTINDFLEFLIEQRRQTKKRIESPGNQGIVISDTDNLVTLMYAKAYVEDPAIDLSSKDYDSLKAMAKNLQRGITWDKIFLLPPKNNFVDDGSRYMAQSSLEERWKNYNILADLLHEFGWWDKVEIINGTYLENFNTVKDYINGLRKF